MGSWQFPPWVKWILFIAVFLLMAAILGYWLVYSDNPARSPR